MKKKILFLVFIPFLLFAFNYYRPALESEVSGVSSAVEDEFLIGFIESAKSMNSYFDELEINFTHDYTSSVAGHFPGNPDRHTPGMWFDSFTYLDNLFDQVPVSLIQNKLDEVSSHNSSKIIWMRPKIEWLAYGQSSIYEAEIVDTSDDYWFYSFNDHETGTDVIDNSQHGNGKKVRYCSTTLPQDNTAGYVVKRLKTNTEQCRKYNFNKKSIGQWQGDSECDWYVKPRIRIPASFVQNNPESDVCKVYVMDQDNNNKITPVTIKAKHFRRDNQPQNQYDGSYLEEFYFVEGEDARPIPFTGDLGDKWVFEARGTRAIDNGLGNKAENKN